MGLSDLGRGLSAVGQDLGTVANYQAEQERFATQQAIADRRERAQMAFRQHLDELNMQNSNEQRGLDRDQAHEQFGQTLEQRKAEMAISQQRADSQDKRTDAQLAIERQRLGLEGARVGIDRDRAEAQKENTGDIKKASAIGSQMKNLGSTIQNARRQMQQEVAGAYKSSDWMMKSDGEKQAILNSIAAKYKPVIDSAQSKYDQYASKWEELTGVADAGSDYQQRPSASDDLGGPTNTPDTATDSGEAAPVGGAGQASTTGNAQTPPRAGAKQAPDGKWYVPDPARPGKWLLVNQ